MSDDKQPSYCGYIWQQNRLLDALVTQTLAGFEEGGKWTVASVVHFILCLEKSFLEGYIQTTKEKYDLALGPRPLMDRLMAAGAQFLARAHSGKLGLNYNKKFEQHCSPSMFFVHSTVEQWRQALDAEFEDETAVPDEWFEVLATSGPSIFILLFVSYNIFVLESCAVERKFFEPTVPILHLLLYICARILVGPYYRSTPPTCFPVPTPTPQCVKKFGAAGARYELLSRLEYFLIVGLANTRPQDLSVATFEKHEASVQADLCFPGVIVTSPRFTGVMFGAYFMEAATYALAKLDGDDVSQLPEKLAIVPYTADLIHDMYVLPKQNKCQYFFDALEQQRLEARKRKAPDSEQEPKSILKRAKTTPEAPEVDTNTQTVFFLPVAVSHAQVQPDKQSVQIQQMTRLARSLNEMLHRLSVFQLAEPRLESDFFQVLRDAQLTNQQPPGGVVARFASFKLDLCNALKRCERWKAATKLAQHLWKIGETGTLGQLHMQQFKTTQEYCQNIIEGVKDWNSLCLARLETQGCVKVFTALHYALCYQVLCVLVAAPSERQALFNTMQELFLQEELQALFGQFEHAIKTANSLILNQGSIVAISAAAVDRAAVVADLTAAAEERANNKDTSASDKSKTKNKKKVQIKE